MKSQIDIDQGRRAKWIYRPQRILYCPTFNDYRVHKLSANREYYTCTCGEVIEFTVNVAPETKGIEL